MLQRSGGFGFIKKKCRINQKIFLFFWGKEGKHKILMRVIFISLKYLVGGFHLPYLFFSGNLAIQLKISVKFHKSNADKIPLRCKMKQKSRSAFLTST